MPNLPARRKPSKAASGGRAAPLWMRLALVALVMVQVVAPSWHVCVLGGNVAHSADRTAQANSSSLYCIPRVTDAPATNISDALAAAASALSGSLSAPHEDCATPCLARLLMGMPGAVSPVQTLAFNTETRPAPFVWPLHLASLAALSQAPSRGPPALSLTV